MNTQQGVIVVLMTGLLFIMVSVLFSAMEEQFRDPNMVRYLFLGLVLILWLVIIFVSDLYMMTFQTRSDLKTYQKQNHEAIMKRYIDTSNASCPQK